PVWSSLYGSRFLTGGVGGSITHQCFYSSTPANKHDRKYWCKITGNGVCYTIISSEHYTSGDYEGRVSLGDVPQNGTFSVTMTGLRSSDTGTYRCGIGTTNEGLFVSLNLTVLADAPVPRPTQLVRGDLHGSVTVLCPSGDTQAGEKRFWCKVGRSSCTLVASSDGYVSRSFQGRVLLTPRESSGAFKVLINDLKKEDSGLYLCGTQRLGGQHSPQEVVLQVTTASALPRRPKFLSGTVGGSLSFQCHHEPGGSYERKYLCRWKGGSCPVLLDDHGFVLEAYRGRIQMSRSDAARGAYTVLLRQLGEQDAGWYWCGAQSGHTEHTASVKLRVLQEICSSQDPETTTPVRFTSGPAAHGTPTQRSVPGLMGTATESTTVGTGTQDSSTLLPTATPGTSATSPGETFQESSSGEPRLLPAVLPALVLLICIAVTALTLAKVKLRKKMGEGRRTTGNLETALDRAGLSPGKEETTEENPSPEEVQECRMGSGKCRWVF
ncbi:PIGR protein, partial [Atrichornis clamosus]|nr:PIGR protein [Atrichornis clamosus]